MDIITIKLTSVISTLLAVTSILIQSASTSQVLTSTVVPVDLPVSPKLAAHKLDSMSKYGKIAPRSAMELSTLAEMNNDTTKNFHDILFSNTNILTSFIESSPSVDISKSLLSKQDATATFPTVTEIKVSPTIFPSFDKLTATDVFTFSTSTNSPLLTFSTFKAHANGTSTFPTSDKTSASTTTILPAFDKPFASTFQTFSTVPSSDELFASSLITFPMAHKLSASSESTYPSSDKLSASSETPFLASDKLSASSETNFSASYKLSASSETKFSSYDKLFASSEPIVSSDKISASTVQTFSTFPSSDDLFASSLITFPITDKLPVSSEANFSVTDKQSALNDTAFQESDKLSIPSSANLFSSSEETFLMSGELSPSSVANILKTEQTNASNAKSYQLSPTPILTPVSFKPSGPVISTPISSTAFTYSSDANTDATREDSSSMEIAVGVLAGVISLALITGVLVFIGRRHDWGPFRTSESQKRNAMGSERVYFRPRSDFEPEVRISITDIMAVAKGKDNGGFDDDENKNMTSFAGHI